MIHFNALAIVKSEQIIYFAMLSTESRLWWAECCRVGFVFNSKINSKKQETCIRDSCYLFSQHRLSVELMFFHINPLLCLCELKELILFFITKVKWWNYKQLFLLSCLFHSATSSSDLTSVTVQTDNRKMHITGRDSTVWSEHKYSENHKACELKV